MERLIDAWAALAWAQCIQVSLAALAALILTRFTRVGNPHWGYLIWALVIIKAVTPPVLSGPFGVFSWWSAAHPHDVAAALPTSAASETVPVEARALLRDVAWDRPTRWAVVAALAVWASGTIVLLGRCGRRLRVAAARLKSCCLPPSPALLDAFRRARECVGVRGPARLFVSTEGHGPLVFGWLRPTVILPQQLVEESSPASLEPILAHELSHVRRADPLLSLVQCVAAAVWWFHPLVWLANRELNRHCELCCDSEAIRATGCSPKQYAEGLLSVVNVRSRLQWLPATAAMKASQVTLGRIFWILDRKRRDFLARTPLACWAVGVAFGLLVLPGARWRSQEEDPRPEAAILAVQQHDWDGAAQQFGDWLVTRPDDSKAWFFLGYSLHREGRWEEAIVANRQAAAMPCPIVRPVALYNWACELALLRRDAEALEKLDEAIAAGFGTAQQQAQTLETDTDWELLREHHDFQTRVQTARRKQAKGRDIT